MNYLSTVKGYENPRYGMLKDPSFNLLTKSFPKEFNRQVEQQLASNTDYNAIFSFVKRIVKISTGNERVGIGLALADLPSQLGAYWEVGGNFIVMNENLLRALKSMNRSTEEINSFIFVILMHEYLHSVGFLNEGSARGITAEICSHLFFTDHPAYVLGTTDPWKVYPFLIMTPTRGNGEIRIVSNFDMNSTPYIV